MRTRRAQHGVAVLAGAPPPSLRDLSHVSPPARAFGVRACSDPPLRLEADHDLVTLPALQRGNRKPPIDGIWTADLLPAFGGGAFWARRVTRVLQFRLYIGPRIGALRLRPRS